jgi:Leucine rich repeat
LPWSSDDFPTCLGDQGEQGPADGVEQRWQPLPRDPCNGGPADLLLRPVAGAAGRAAGRSIVPSLTAPTDNAAMPTEPTKAAPPKRQRRWCQFSLRTLLVFTLICAIPCAWLGRRIERKRKEREAVEAIIKLGGHVLYDYQATTAGISRGPDWLRKLLGENLFSEVEIVSFQGTGDTDVWLENVRGLTQLHRLSLNDTNVTDVGLTRLKELNQLKSLGLCGTKVTDAGLENLKGLSQLQELDLSGNDITATGLQHLKGLSQLEWLDLSETKTTDAGLVKLRELTQLYFLDLRNTQVTDAGLANLKGLTHLKQVNLRGVRVTDAGVKDLQKALPNCEILR